MFLPALLYESVDRNNGLSLHIPVVNIFVQVWKTLTFYTCIKNIYFCVAQWTNKKIVIPLKLLKFLIPPTWSQ